MFSLLCKLTKVLWLRRWREAIKSNILPKHQLPAVCFMERLVYSCLSLWRRRSSIATTSSPPPLWSRPHWSSWPSASGASSRTGMGGDTLGCWFVLMTFLKSFFQYTNNPCTATPSIWFLINDIIQLQAIINGVSLQHTRATNKIMSSVRLFFFFNKYISVWKF